MQIHFYILFFDKGLANRNVCLFHFVSLQIKLREEKRASPWLPQIHFDNCVVHGECTQGKKCCEKRKAL
jgi:hypothetical protein